MIFMNDNKSLRKIMAAAAFAPALFTAQSAASAGYSGDTPLEPIVGKSTAVLEATPPRIDAQNNATFTIDISSLGIFRKLGLAGSQYTALVFEGSSTQQDRLCPFFNLKSRDYKIEEVRPDVFEIYTKVTEEEFSSVEKAGCAITTSPERRRIKFLP